MGYSVRLRLVWFLCAWCQVAAARAQLFQGPYGSGGSWNVYEFVDERVTWRAALDEASSHSYAGVDGQLADIVSAEENAFLEWISGHQPAWIGLTDREGAAPPGISGGLPAPQESLGLADPRGQGWAWTSGTQYAYQNWAVVEPRDFLGGEDAVHLMADGRWNDLGSGYGPDEPLAPTLQPGTSLAEQPWLRSYLVEYPLERQLPLPEIAVPSVPARMPARLPGGLGTDGTLRVTDLRGDFQVGEQIQDASRLVTEIVAGRVPATSVSALYPRADLTDPDANSGGGPIIDQPPFPFPADRPGEIDANLISVAQGTLHVPETGIYTLQVRSSEGFALQIGDATFQSVHGDGQIDGTDSRTLYHGGGTFDTNTRGVIGLSEGDHELRFLHWANTPFAYWEITSALGAHAFDSSAQWLALGDTSVRAERTDAPVVHLVQPATVVTVAEDAGGRADDLDVARENVQEALANRLALTRNDVTTVVLRDEDGICCQRPGAALEADQMFLWPLNDPTWGGQDFAADHFSSAIFGQLMVDDGDEQPGETLPVTFGMFASDAARLHIVGEDFIAGNLLADLSNTVDGDTTLSIPFLADNSDSLGLIELTEGQVYDFEATHFDDTADAGFELWTALGTHLDGFDSLYFLPLGSGPGLRTLPRNVGLGFVAPSAILGDHNRDGLLDLADVTLQIDAIRGADSQFDLNQDGQIDQGDLETWIRTLKGTWIGDADLDGYFDSHDLIVVLSEGKYENGLPATWSQGDWNGDRRFATSDLVAALRDGGYQAGRRAPSVAVPEGAASSVWALALALALFAVRSRTRQSCSRTRQSCSRTRQSCSRTRQSLAVLRGRSLFERRCGD